MFIAGVTTAVEPPYNDIWTVPDEAAQLAAWQAADRALAAEVDTQSHYHRLQIADFLAAIRDGRPPLVPGAEGRKAVALFEAVYRAQQTGLPVRLNAADRA